MLYRALLLAAVAVATLCHAGRAAQFKPVLADVALDNAYIPIGFDSNDRSQLVVSGNLPNTCFRIASADADVDQQNKTIVIHQKAYVYLSYCLQMMIPYVETINVGLLDAGKYQVLDGKTHKSLGSLDVKQATRAEPDDYLYLPLQDAYVEQSSPSLTEVVLTGSYPDSCFSFDRAIVNYHTGLIEVQPIGEHTQGANCTQGQVPFMVRVPLQKSPSGTFLLHVRSLNGQSINKLTELP